MSEAHRPRSTDAQTPTTTLPGIDAGQPESLDLKGGPDCVTCWNCGRETTDDHAEEYVFGHVCDHQDCNQIKQALDQRFEMFWFKTMPSGPLTDDEFSSFSADGEPQTPPGMVGPGTLRQAEIDEESTATTKAY